MESGVNGGCGVFVLPPRIVLMNRTRFVILLGSARVSTVVVLVLLPWLAWSQPATRLTTRRVFEVPGIFIEAKDAIAADKKVPCTMQVVMPEGNKDAGEAVTRDATMRIRGASSQGFPKKSFAVSLESPAEMLGMTSRAHWILNAAYIDRSLMRHKLGYDLFRSLARPGQPRHAAASRFVEVHLNEEYQGVYLLMEHVDGHLLGLTPFVKEDAVHACLYKAVNHDASFAKGGHEGFVQHVPDPLAAYWQPLDALNEFIHGAAAEKFLDAQMGIETQLDIDNAIDFHLLVLVTGNADGITKNFYLARARPEGAAVPRFFFVPWDYDGTFGRNWDASRLPPELWLSNHLFDRLLQAPAYRQRFVARWQQLREKEFSVPTIQGMIDANAKELGAAAARNAIRWAAGAGSYPDRVSFEQDVTEMKTWIAAHIAWLDRTIRRKKPL